MSSNPLVLTPIEGGPRVHDLALAGRLEFSQVLDIRKLIKRNEAKLLKFGVLATMAKTSGDLGGRPTSEYFLNQKQAIFVCMKSETDKAFDVQVEIVRVFDAYLSGEIKFDPPAPPVPVRTREPISPTKYYELKNLIHEISSCCHWHGKAHDAAWARVRKDCDADSVLRLPVESFDYARDLLKEIQDQAKVYFKDRLRRDEIFIEEVIRRGSKLQLVLSLLPAANE